jgi:uncharacterized protein YndB with AHSA1/START domain
MTESTQTLNNAADRQAVNTRIFNTRRELVFKAFAEPDQLSKWWGPKGFTNTFQDFNFTEGGNWEFIMHGPDGKNYPNQCVFEEIVVPERIVLSHTYEPHFLATFVLEDIGEQTRLTFTQLFDNAEVYSKIKHIVVPANEENFDRLEMQLAKL